LFAPLTRARAETDKRAAAAAGLRGSPVGFVAARALRLGLCDIGPHQFDKVSSPQTFGRWGRS
jgi:hypothetical protein